MQRNEETTMIAKLAVFAATLAIGGHLAAQCAQTPAGRGAQACIMYGPNGKTAPFRLVVGRQTMSLDFGQGDQFVFPVNQEMSDDKFQVAAKREKNGSVSILLDQTNGEFQETILIPGQVPDFLYGKCSLTGPNRKN